MYRPDRIGPYMFGDIEEPPILRTAGELLTSVSDLLIPRFFPNPNVGEDVRSSTMDMVGPAVIPAGQSVGLCIQVSGVSFNVRNSLVAYGVSVRWESPKPDVLASVVLGRDTESGQGAGVQTAWHMLVPSAIRSSGTNVHQLTANDAVVIGDFRGTGTEGETPLVLGVWWQNFDAAAVSISNIKLSMSLQRYLHDIDTIDPNR